MDSSYDTFHSSSSRSRNAFAIGIAGGIGAGKSVVSRMLRLMGYSVYDCDVEAHRLMDSSRDFKLALAETLGEDMISGSWDGGEIDRAVLAGRVFGDDEALAWLNSKVHAMVREDISSWISRHDNAPCFIESAIMASSGLLKYCGSVWWVDAPVELRIHRAMRRSGMTREQVVARMAAQKVEFEAIENSGTPLVFIDNSGMQSILARIRNLLNLE